MNAVNHVNHRETPPKLPPKAPSSPALPRQNPKVTPPSPPKIITDKSGKLQFHRVGFLGEVCWFSRSYFDKALNEILFQGGFARVYEVKDVQGSRLACKVVTKSSLKTKKAKTKVQKFNPPYICHFSQVSLLWYLLTLVIARAGSTAPFIPSTAR